MKWCATTSWKIYLCLLTSSPSQLQIAQMEIEIQGIPQSIRPQYQTRIRLSKADLAHYKKLSREMHAQASRADLFSRAPATSDEPYGSSDRARLLAGTTILEDGSRRLHESQRIALETEEQGADILRNLIGQREQIENARNTVRCRPTQHTRPCSFPPPSVCRADLWSIHSSKLRIIPSTERPERSKR
jgi:Snare region anchored in the vesicle membrane C-terminus/Vesicle transport v-SNARE protein N-terminus